MFDFELATPKSLFHLLAFFYRYFPGDDASGMDTIPNAIMCGKNEVVKSHTCAKVGSGRYTNGGHDASGPDTVGEPVVCGPNEFVKNFQCANCVPGSVHADGADSLTLFNKKKINYNHFDFEMSTSTAHHVRGSKC